jgi:hypothetical protein
LQWRTLAACSTALMLTMFLVGVPVAEAAPLSYTLVTSGNSGSYTLGSTTTNYTNATLTYSAVADPANVASGTINGEFLYYLLVSSVQITLVDTNGTTTFSAGAQTLQYNGFSALASMAVMSQAPQNLAFSEVGFGVIDVVPNTDYPANSVSTPFGMSVAKIVSFGTGNYRDLQTVGLSTGAAFVPSLALAVTSGAQSGTFNTSFQPGSPTFTIAAAPVPAPTPGSLGLILAALSVVSCSAWRRRRRD